MRFKSLINDVLEAKFPGINKPAEQSSPGRNWWEDRDGLERVAEEGNKGYDIYGLTSVKKKFFFSIDGGGGYEGTFRFDEVDGLTFEDSEGSSYEYRRELYSLEDLRKALDDFGNEQDGWEVSML